MERQESGFRINWMTVAEIRTKIKPKEEFLVKTIYQRYVNKSNIDIIYILFSPDFRLVCLVSSNMCTYCANLLDSCVG